MTFFDQDPPKTIYELLWMVGRYPNLLCRLLGTRWRRWRLRKGLSAESAAELQRRRLEAGLSKVLSEMLFDIEQAAKWGQSACQLRMSEDHQFNVQAIERLRQAGYDVKYDPDAFGPVYVRWDHLVKRGQIKAVDDN